MQNMLKVGEANTMTFEGSASHGGGTCQLSVTQDRQPTANSTFKVIQSWIGGCPTSSTSGGTHPWNYTIPSEVPNGKATLAWTWVSKLSGQPELYMNCAPITVSGGASDTTEFDALENLFLVNLPSSSCGSQLSSDLEIPNPGKYVLTIETTALATPTGTGCAALGQASATEKAAGSASASGVQLSFQSSATAIAASSAGSEGTTTLTSTTMLTLTSPNGNLSVAAPTSAPTGATSIAASAPTSTAGTGSTGSTGSSTGGNSTSTGSDSCTTNGAIVCNGPTQFGLCNFGSVVYMPVAAGTTCENGQIMRRLRHRHVRLH
ncbi:hypothetical protein M8818_006951 [Zalaria obscura]|uniref:Uncharacterized protein n=1 Tax=Zalaria obscura TaxID=2024903 RepID=A0ACC3S633_9PEZI